MGLVWAADSAVNRAYILSRHRVAYTPVLQRTKGNVTQYFHTKKGITQKYYICTFYKRGQKNWIFFSRHGSTKFPLTRKPTNSLNGIWVLFAAAWYSSGRTEIRSPIRSDYLMRITRTHLKTPGVNAKATSDPILSRLTHDIFR